MSPVRILVVAVLCACAAHAWSKTFVIDVRTPQEYAEGHLPGAINLEYTGIAQQIFKAGVAKDDEVILYCRTGRRSAAAQETLKSMGFTRLKDYGGIEDARRQLAP